MKNPRQWIADGNGFEKTFDVSDENGSVATVKTSRADADLIAAAPNMFDALAAIEDYAEGCYRDVMRNGEHDTQHFCPICRSTIGHDDECPMPLVLTALKKAEGKK